MVRKCNTADLKAIIEIINEAAQAYQGVIPDDCFHRPYMALKELGSELDSGVDFWGWEESGELTGVMGLQNVRDVTLIRHAYVKAASQGRGIGSTLVGTWAAADWAIRLYQRHGFILTDNAEKDTLLDKYWTISARQKETSVVLKQDLPGTLSPDQELKLHLPKDD
jgi:N-acetylglutamate synthase-like GNAT family acetyltransferase